MCIICLIKLKLLGKTLNQYHAKCMRFSKMQLVSHCYTAVLFEPISKLYIYKNPALYLFDAMVTLFFVCLFFVVFFFLFVFFCFLLIFFARYRN